MSQLNQNTEDLQELLNAVNNLPTGSGGNGGGSGNIINIPIKVVNYDDIEPTYSSVDVYYVNDQRIACMEHITEDTTINALEGSILVVHGTDARGIIVPQQLPDGPLLLVRDWDGYPIVVVKVQSSLYIQTI